MEHKHVERTQLENLLKKKSRQRIIVKMEDRELKEYFRDGDHYLSSTYKEGVIVSNESGQQWKENLVIKAIPDREITKKYLEEEGIFEREIIMYSEVLKSMEDEMCKKDVAGEILWPECIGIKPYNLLILEDLTAKGYRKVDRLCGLDLEQATYAFKAIAKFHALSITLKDKFLNNKKLNYYQFGKYTTKRADFFKVKVQELTSIMLKKWEPKWHKLAESLLKNQEDLFKKHTTLCNPNEDDFIVLNHGDLWTSNILFKHCEFTDKIIGIRFVDFQISNFNSFAMDLLYISQTSLQPHVRLNHMDDLVMAYYQTLTAVSLITGKVDTIPSLADIKVGLMRKRLYGLAMSIYLLDMMLVPPSDAVNMDTLFSQGVDNFANNVMHTAVYEQRMKAILEPFLDTDLTTLC